MDNTYVSKDDGLTWTKRTGNSLTRSVYDGKFVDVGTSLSLITKRQRTDGSSISPDVITIGQEGSMTVIGGSTTLGATTATTLNVIGGYVGIGGSTTLGATTATTLNVIGGYVGIGTLLPKYGLHIEAWSRLANDELAGYLNGSGATTTSNTTIVAVHFASAVINSTTVSSVNGWPGANWPMVQTISALATGSYITMGAFLSVSDRRIKTNIVDIEDDIALRDLRLLKPKTYTYKDVVQKGSSPVYGFIAQEVKEVLKYASSPMTEIVPNVYQLATFSGDILTLTFNTADLSRDPSGALFPRLKLKTREEKDEFVNILEIIDEHTLRVDTDMSEWGGQLVGDQIVPGNRIFVYGQEVNDFHTLNKDAIWTVATAALQEVDRQLQAEKQKTVLMKTDYDAKLSNLEARLLALETKV